MNCVTCHHNFVQRGLGPKPCYACHKAWGTTELRRIDTVFHTFCTDCHRRWGVAGEKAGPVKSAPRAASTGRPTGWRCGAVNGHLRGQWK